TSLNVFLADSSAPVWSPDGSKIAFASRRALDGSNAVNTHGTQNVWVMNADGSSPAPLTKLTAIAGTGFNIVGADSFNPVWSLDGSKIAFVSKRALDGSDAVNANGAQNIWVMNADDSGLTPLTKLTACVNCLGNGLNPVWSPDGNKIAFVSE